MMTTPRHSLTEMKIASVPSLLQNPSAVPAVAYFPVQLVASVAPAQIVPFGTAASASPVVVAIPGLAFALPRGASLSLLAFPKYPVLFEKEAVAAAVAVPASVVSEVEVEVAVAVVVD